MPLLQGGYSQSRQLGVAQLISYQLTAKCRSVTRFGLPAQFKKESNDPRLRNGAFERRISDCVRDIPM